MIIEKNQGTQVDEALVRLSYVYTLNLSICIKKHNNYCFQKSLCTYIQVTRLTICPIQPYLPFFLKNLLDPLQHVSKLY